MPIITIPKRYLVNQDDESITVDVPASVVKLWQCESEEVASVSQLPTADRVRDKLEALGITEVDLADAIAWVRQDA